MVISDCFLYISIHSKALSFVCLFHWPKHMMVTGGEIWTVGGMWKNFIETVAASYDAFLQIWVWHFVEENDDMH